MRHAASPDQAPPQAMGPFTARLWDLNERTARIEEKLDVALTNQTKYEALEERVRTLELADAQGVSRRTLLDRVFTVILTVGLAVIGLGVWWK